MFNAIFLDSIAALFGGLDIKLASDWTCTINIGKLLTGLDGESPLVMVTGEGGDGDELVMVRVVEKVHWKSY